MRTKHVIFFFSCYGFSSVASFSYWSSYNHWQQSWASLQVKLFLLSSWFCKCYPTTTKMDCKSTPFFSSRAAKNAATCLHKYKTITVAFTLLLKMHFQGGQMMGRAAPFFLRERLCGSSPQQFYKLKKVIEELLTERRGEFTKNNNSM